MNKLISCVAAALLMTACAETESGGPSVGDAGAVTHSRDATLADAAVRAPDLSTTVPLPRGGKTAASIHALPNSICRLRRAESAPADGDMEIVSDEDGIARVYFQHIDTAVARVELAMDCNDEVGHALTQTISVTVDDSATEQSPAPVIRTGKKTLPVLEGDPISYSPKDLKRRGYPPRPDPQTTPEAYATWVRLVTSGPTMVDPQSHPSRGQGCTAPATIPNWSGASAYSCGAVPCANDAGHTIGAVSGEFAAPPILYADAGYVVDATAPESAALWVGLGVSPNLIQDGTWSKVWYPGGIAAQSLNAWTESVPSEYAQLNSLPIKPGDIIYAAVWADTPSSSGDWPTNAFASPINYPDASFSGQPATLADVDGDGMADIVLFDVPSGSTCTAIYVELAQVNGGFANPKLWTSAMLSFPGSQGFGVGDFNNDSKADVVAVNGTQAWVMLSNGSSFGGPNNWQPSSVPSFGVDVPWTIADVDGNGSMDLVELTSGNAVVAMESEYPTNSMFGSLTTLVSSITFNPNGLNPTITLGDINADGKADIVAFPYSNNELYDAGTGPLPVPDGGCVQSTSDEGEGGTSWNEACAGPWYVGLILSNPDGGGYSSPTRWAYATSIAGLAPRAVVDVNGDGLGDFVALQGSYDVMLAIAAGSLLAPGLAPSAGWLTNGPIVPGNGSAALLGHGFGDVNGDCRTDVAVFTGNNATNGTLGTDVMLAQSSPDWGGGNVGEYFIWNQTQNVAYSRAQAYALSQLGNEAEWVMERPLIPGGQGQKLDGGKGYSLLPNFGSAAISNTFAQGINGAIYTAPANSAPGHSPFDMTDTSNAFLSCATLTATGVSFAWVAVQ